jgi:hypothetical protein
MLIAVDFDGTIVEHKYPSIGKEIPFATATLKQLIQDGHRLVLWTNRQGELLQEALDWCRDKGVEFYAANSCYPEEQADSGEPRKIKADIYIDDRNVGGLPDWGVIYELIKHGLTLQEYLMQQMGQPSKPKKKHWWQ